MRDDEITPKQRMLNAYRGIFSDRYPVAPEFWYYYPAKMLGVDMVQFELEVPFWQALQTTFKYYGADGWGAISPVMTNPHKEKDTSFEKIGDGKYQENTKVRYKGKEFVSTRYYQIEEPSWRGKRPVGHPDDLPAYIDMLLSPQNEVDFSAAIEAHREVGEEYLLELSLGSPFFDLIAEAMGFEESIFLFMSGDAEPMLKSWQAQFIGHQRELVRKACDETEYESFFIGCAFSNNSLMGPRLWRKWDKPYIKAIAEEIHLRDRLLHVHVHGNCMETVSDFAEIGIDCVCPFERPPGGNVAGIEGLRAARKSLQTRVTFNGNVHTVETLIRGTPEDVRREVREIKEAFCGSPRLIIGTGDQVGRETPEENILALLDEGWR